MNRAHIIPVMRLLRILILGLFLITGTASAQLFQTVDGGAGVESGRGGVTPIAGGGYISVGHSTSFGPTADVYVAQTNAAGALVWAFAYDFGNRQDFGYDIHACVNGDYVITGSTANAAGNDMFVLRITGAGGVVWGNIIATPNDDQGKDVLEAANGDIVAAGWVSPAPGLRDGLIARFTAVGGPIGSNQYFTGINLDDYFNGLWEAGNGDLIVCGSTNSFNNNYQGWIVRITPANLIAWSGHFGLMAPNAVEVFNSVIELTVGPQAGNIVAAGSTTGIPGDPMDYYMVKVTGGGIFLAPDITGGTPIGAEEMFQVRENQMMSAGNLILAGHMNPGPLGGDDGYAVEMTPVWNCPMGKVWSMAYGGAAADQLYSAREVPNNCFLGYILCGHTASPTLVPPGDPQQHYLIKTDMIGSSHCNEMRPPDRCTQPNYPMAIIPVGTPPGPVPMPMAPAVMNARIGAVICFMPCPPPATKGNLTGASNILAELNAAFPNPVAAGSTFQVQYVLNQGVEASITVSDMKGAIVYDRSYETETGSGSLQISTVGWATGSYMVKMDLGGEIRTQRIVVLDR